MFRFNKLALISISFLLSLTLLAQDKDDWKEKVKNLKGDITKIVIQTNDGVVTLSGKDAEEAFKNLKGNSFVFYSDDDVVHLKGKEHSAVWHYLENCDEENVFSIKEADGKHLIWITEELDGEDGDTKEVEVEVEDGKKKVTITTTKDGKETVEVLEGEDAEEYLKKHNKSKGTVGVYSSGKNFMKKFDKNSKNVWVYETLDEEEGDEKNVKVEVKDGKKIVTITITKDGKESTEVLEGKEADEYLEKHNKKTGDIAFYSSGNFALKKINKKDHNVWLHKVHEDDDGDEKNIKVEVKDGKKVVTVTTTKDGKEKTEVFEGEEADKYLEKNMDHHFEFGDEDANIMIMKAPHKSGRNYAYVEAFADGDDCREKKIDVEIIDGKKVVTIKTTKDGKETIVELDGEDAEGFIKADGHDFHIMLIDEDDLDTGALIKILESKCGDDDGKKKRYKVYITDKENNKKVKEVKIKKVKKESKKEEDKK